MKERTYPGSSQPVVACVVYWVSQVDIFLFLVWIATHNNAVWTSGLILAVVFGGIMLFRPQLFLPCRRRFDPTATAIEVQTIALFHFALAVLLGLGERLSTAVALGILVLVACIQWLFSVLLHRREKSPWLFAASIAASLSIGALGIFLIYIHPPFNLDSAVLGIIGGTLGGLASLVRARYRPSRERNPYDSESTVPPRRLIPPLVGWNLPPSRPRRRNPRSSTM